MSGDGWESMSHAEIVAKLSALQPDGAFNAAQKWSDIYTKVSDAAEHYRSADTKMSQIWTGEDPTPPGWHSGTSTQNYSPTRAFLRRRENCRTRCSRMAPA